MRQYLCSAIAIALSACGDHEQENAAAPAAMNEANRVDAAPAPAENAARPAPIAEGPIDPKSVQGAGQVVQHYAALIEQRRFDEAKRLWERVSDADAFEAALSGYSEVHTEIGAPSEPEGAAGSIYVVMPVRFYGRTASGETFSQPATVTLRRVNDVPGSTEEQRRWRISKIETR
jgi:hypothetical protein